LRPNHFFVLHHLSVTAPPLAAAAADDADEYNGEDHEEETTGRADDDELPVPIKTFRVAVIALLVIALITNAHMEGRRAATVAVAVTGALVLAFAGAGLDGDVTHVLLEVVTGVLEVDNARDKLRSSSIHTDVGRSDETASRDVADEKSTVVVCKVQATNHADFDDVQQN